MTDFTLRNFLHTERHDSALKILCVAFGLLSLALLTACGGKGDKNFYLRVTVDATYNGQPVSGSSVILQPLFLLPPEGRTVGEALTIDLGGGKHLYMPLVERSKFNPMYYSVIWNAYGPTVNPEGKKVSTTEIEALLSKLPVGTKAQWNYSSKRRFRSKLKYAGYPMFIGFTNELNPETAFLIETESPSTVFHRQFELKGIYFERVSPDTPLTKTLHTQLPWVESTHKHWSGRSSEDSRFPYTFKHLPKGEISRNASLTQRLRRRHFSSKGFRE